jgi:hypothetical protein
MKITNKEVKECEMPDWTKTKVLDLEYTHKWTAWRILVKDYNDDFYDYILKQLRVKVREYFLTTQKWA